ncbi:MAG TPA: class I SAM-dependent methyltransferase, partial [Nitrospirota bacterium]|nr:class I SAM-dependent methyltransferase [Nitrospirota bacterium]
MLLVPPRRSDPELLDLPGGAVEYSELCGSLSDIRRVNRFLGGTGSIVKTFSRMVEDARRRGEIKDRITLLDVAAGSADVPAALVEWGKSRGIGIKVTAVDVNEYVVRHAREWTDGKGAFDFVAADAL